MAREDSYIGAVSQTLEDEQRVRPLLNLTPDQVFIHDLNGRLLYINDALIARCGYSREEMLTIYPWDQLNQHYMVANWRGTVPGEPVLMEDLNRRNENTAFAVEIRLR